MRYEELKDAIKNAKVNLSDMACHVFDYVLDRFDETDEDIDENDVYDAVYEECDSMFIYYSDAWDYLQDQCITDFTEAIDNVGAKNICGIACYYLEQEVLDSLCL